MEHQFYSTVNHKYNHRIIKDYFIDNNNNKLYWKNNKIYFDITSNFTRDILHSISDFNTA